MKSKVEPVKKASNNPLTEAKGHPDGPSLIEMIDGQEEKILGRKKRKRKDNRSDGPIPII